MTLKQILNKKTKEEIIKDYIELREEYRKTRSELIILKHRMEKKK